MRADGRCAIEGGRQVDGQSSVEPTTRSIRRTVEATLSACSANPVLVVWGQVWHATNVRASRLLPLVAGASLDARLMEALGSLVESQSRRQPDTRVAGGWPDERGQPQEEPARRLTIILRWLRSNYVPNWKVSVVGSSSSSCRITRRGVFASSLARRRPKRMRPVDLLELHLCSTPFFGRQLPVRLQDRPTRRLSTPHELIQSSDRVEVRRCLAVLPSNCLALTPGVVKSRLTLTARHIRYIIAQIARTGRPSECYRSRKVMPMDGSSGEGHLFVDETCQQKGTICCHMLTNIILFIV